MSIRLTISTTSVEDRFVNERWIFGYCRTMHNGNEFNDELMSLDQRQTLKRAASVPTGRSGNSNEDWGLCCAAQV
jgi:hypothetical protein